MPAVSQGATRHARELLERLYSRAVSGRAIEGRELEMAARALVRLPEAERAGQLERIYEAIEAAKRRPIRLSRNQSAREKRRHVKAGSLEDMELMFQEMAELDERLRAHDAALEAIAQQKRVEARYGREPGPEWPAPRRRRLWPFGKRNPGTVPQSILLRGGSGMTAAEFRAWLRKEGFKARLEKVGTHYRAQQRSPMTCDPSSYRTLTEGFPAGVSMIVCRPARRNAYERCAYCGAAVPAPAFSPGPEHIAGCSRHEPARRRRRPLSIRAKKNPGPNVKRLLAAIRRLRKTTGRPYQLAGSLGRTCLVLRGKRVTRLLNPSDLLRAIARKGARANHPCRMAGANPGTRVLYPRVAYVGANETRKGIRGKPRGLYQHDFTSKAPVLGVGAQGATAPPGSILIPAGRKALWNVH